MRVIAGWLGGRQFSSPTGHRTHPMSDKMRGALFSALGDIGGLSVLDAFAGSGALAIEALSRGAAHVVAIDNAQPAQKAIEANRAVLGISSEQLQLIRASAQAWLGTTDMLFDLVLCDPPYDNIQPQLLERLAARAKPGGLIVFSLPPSAEVTLPDQYELASAKSYGDAQLVFYRRIE